MVNISKFQLSQKFRSARWHFEEIKKFKKIFFTFFQWQKQPSIVELSLYLLVLEGDARPKIQLFIPREIWKRCMTNAEHQIFSRSPENLLKKKKKSNVFKFKKKSRKCVRVRAHSHSLLASLFIRFLFGIMSSVLRGSAPHLLCWFPCVTYVYVTVFSMFYILYYS